MVGLITEWQRLRSEVARHKAAIRTHRELLQKAAAEQARIESEAARRGISLISVPGNPEGIGAHPEPCRPPRAT